MQADVVIFGGGAAGLWLLNDLTRRGIHALLLESHKLGAGQTIAAQGIIHGGLKYTLHGVLTPSATQIRDMPELWRKCLAGDGAVDLSKVRLRSENCHLWRTDSVGSRLGMLGARLGLRVKPQVLEEHQRPGVLSRCPGPVAEVDEPVLAPDSLLAALLAGHEDRVLRFDPAQMQIDCTSPGNVTRIRLNDADTGRKLEIVPRQVVLTAGRGNSELQRRIGLKDGRMQTRQLHMILVRGELPVLNGHCVDGRSTRVTITSDRDTAGRTVWQVGGQIAEIGVELDDQTLLARAEAELTEVLPGLDLSRAEWSTYRVDRAERATPGNARPDAASVLLDGNVITAWPTKLALVPVLSERILAVVSPASGSSNDIAECAGWPTPAISSLPWERRRPWYTAHELQDAALLKAA